MLNDQEYEFLTDLIYDWIGMWEAKSWLQGMEAINVVERLKYFMTCRLITIYQCSFENEDRWAEFDIVNSLNVNDISEENEDGLWEPPFENKLFVIQATDLWRHLYRTKNKQELSMFEFYEFSAL